MRMRKIRKRVFAVVLAAALFFTMPGMVSYAEADDDGIANGTEDNVEKVQVQLDKIFDLYWELTAEEQEQIDISRCLEQQEAMDAVNAPMPLTTGDVTLSAGTSVTFTADENQGADGSLTISSADVLDSSTILEPNVAYSITAAPTEDMIVVPELVYTGELLDTSDIKNDDSKIGTDLEGMVMTCNGDTLTTSFTASDTITVKATPKATEQDPTNATMMTASFTAPTAGQMALFVGGTQISEPVNAENGTYTMTASASDVLTLGQVEPNGDAITLTAKFVGNGNMADAAATVEVKISAVAKVEMGSVVIAYLSESDFAKAFYNENYDNATVTLLSDAQPDSIDEGKVRTSTAVDITCTLDLAGYKFTSSDVAIYILPNGDLTIQDSSSGKTGQVVSTNGAAIFVEGSASLMGGTYIGNPAIDGRNLSTGMSSLLANYGKDSDTHFAYFDKDGKPLAGVLDQKELTGTVTVQECTNHVHQEQSYLHDTGSTKHTQTCAACGTVEEVDCEYTKYGETYNIKVCACGATLTASLTGADNLVYNGARQTPGATFMVDGVTPRDVANVKTYTYNKDAGTATLAILDANGVFWGILLLDFTIAKATPEITWNGGSMQTLTYTGQEAAVTADVKLVNNETGTVSYSYAEQGSDRYTPGLPTDVGIYSVKASFAEQKNYVTAEAEMTLTIAPLEITVTPYSGQHKEYGADDPTLTYTITPSLIGDDKLTGALSYTGIEAGVVGQHEIIQNTLAAPSENYTLTFTPGVMFEITKPSLEKANVTVNGSFTYDGTAQVPTADQVKVVLNGTEIPSSQYTISASDNSDAGTATVTITAAADGNYSGSASGEFIIAKADVAKDALPYTPPADLIYTGEPKTASVTANGLTGIGQITVKYKKDNKGDFLTEAVEPGTYHVYAVISGATNYNDTQIEMGSFTISYMEAPKLLYNGNEKKEYYSGDVAITAVPADGHTYKVSDTIDGGYQSSYTISAQEGTVTKTLYFKDEDGHISDGVKISVDFDLTPPTGGIAVGAKWWQNVLNFITFGHYAVQDYTVTIKAEDKGGSGIEKIEYVIVTGASQYDDADKLAAASLNWTEYNGSKPTVSASMSQYVIYVRLTDKAGNVTYISTDGILLDDTKPQVTALTVPEEMKNDVTAGITFTVSEAVSYYYVVLPQGSTAPSAEDIIVTCRGTLPEGKTGTAIDDITHDSGTVSADMLADGVSVEAKNLSSNTKYTVYVTAVDTAVDITNSEAGTFAGNIGTVVQADFTTKKTLPVITNAPTVTGIYGQSVGEMTVTGGTAKGGDIVLTGTWTVSDVDSGKIPAAGTTEEVTVIFTPDSDSYDSVSVKVIPAVSQRSLNADGVTISEVAGTYTYTGSEFKPLVAVNTGTPTSGIYISDSKAALTANDFTVSYSNNTNAGTASVTITGKGNYTGLVTRTFTIQKAPGRTILELKGSYTNDGQTYTYTITTIDDAVYRMGDGAWTEGNVFKVITPGTVVTFSAKIPENENYEEGEAKSITVNFPKLTPAAPALSYTRKADRETGNITLSITEIAGAEYSFDGGATWQGTAEQDGFDASQTVTLAIRLKETETHNPSPAQKVTVNLAKEDWEAPPPFTLQYEANGETDYTVTIPPTEGCEYSFDGETWLESNIKTGVKVGETVTGYKRYKETDEYNTSSAVSDSERMPKFTVKAPVISPAGGSCSGSISVTITCGTPDATVYYTTDGSTPDSSSTRYTGAFTVSAPATVKAIAIKDGLNDSAVVTAIYTKQDSGGSGGSGDSGGGNSGEGGSGSVSGDSGDNGQENNEDNGGENTVRQGTETEPGSGRTASLAFTHASDYVIARDGDEEESSNVTEPAQPGNQDENSFEATEESLQTGQVLGPWWLIVVGALVIVLGISIFFVVKKKRESENNR